MREDIGCRNTNGQRVGTGTGDGDGGGGGEKGVHTTRNKYSNKYEQYDWRGLKFLLDMISKFI